MKVSLTNSAVLAVAYLSNLEGDLKIVLLLLTIGYTARKWMVGEKRAKKGKSFESLEESDFKHKHGDE